MGRFLGILTAVVVGAAGALAAVHFGLLPSLGAARSTSDAAIEGDGVTTPRHPPVRVVALARLEPAAGIIELSGVPGDRITKLTAVPGQTVKRDAELVTFESRTLRVLDVDAAKSQLAEAEKRLIAEQVHADALVRSAQLGVDGLILDDLELSAQRTKLLAMEKGLEIAKRDYDRLSKLDAKITSKQELEHAQLMRDRAEIELAASQEMIKKLDAGRGLRQRESEATLDQAKAARAKVEPSVPIESLRMALAGADERLRLSTLKAPSDGTILEVLADEGDVVGPTPIVRLANLSAMSARAEVYETQAGAVRIGQKVVMTADALPGSISGVVERVGVVVGGNRLMSLDPRRTTDNRIVEVRIRLDDAALASRFVNLQVTATIDTATK